MTSKDNDRTNDSEQLKHGFQEAEALIMKWQVEDTMAWNDSKDDAIRYLSAVDDLLAMLIHTQSLLESAMLYLEELFRLTLIRNTLDVNKVMGSLRIASLSGDNVAVEVVSSSFDKLRQIAKRMIKSGYEKECCQVFTGVRKDALDESLANIGIEKVGTEDVENMDWDDLDIKMKKWAKGVKMVVKEILCKEKELCGEVFEGFELIQWSCYMEIANMCVMQMLNFGNAVANAKRTPEKLFNILDMYDALSDVYPELEELFNDEAGKPLCREVKDALKALGEAAVGTLCEFEKRVQGEANREPVQRGDIHPMTKYVMNYINFIVAYCNTLNQLLENHDDELLESSSQSDVLDNADMSPIGRQLLLITSLLEKNLEQHSKLYRDIHLGFIFMMNNIRYMVQKVNDSELHNVLGDEWIGSYTRLTHQYANRYFRGCWTTPLSFLEGIDSGSFISKSAMKLILVERFNSFSTCFEDIYKTQTGWKIKDPDLSKDIRAMISVSLLKAYRGFLVEYSKQTNGLEHSENYLKYSAERLKEYVQDLFEEVPRDLTMQ